MMVMPEFQHKSGEAQSPEKPVFDGGAFTIEFLAPNQGGFELVTRNSLRRRQGKYPPGAPLPWNQEQRGKVTPGIKRDVSYSKELSGIAEGEKPVPAHKRARYMEVYGSTQKVGVRNPEAKGNILEFDTVAVPFSFYRNISEPHETPESLELADPTGTALILFTEDGKMILQHRKKFDPETRTGNSLYGDVPGASAAGIMDRPKDKPSATAGTLPEITSESVKRNLSKEMAEEIGLTEQDIEDLVITGLASDKTRIHKEFLLYAKTKLTVDQVRKKAETAKGNEKPDGEHDFSEDFFVIDGSAEGLRKLLTEVKCPLPPTHAAAFVAAGYNMVLENQGVEQAEQWRTGMEQEIQRNWTEIDEIVKNYYLEHPEALERNAGANPNGYDADFLPEDQGLPSLNSELVRLHLESDIEKSIEEAFLFDIDGVITDPDEKRITQVELLDSIIRRLELGYPIGFNTGRAINWVSERVINPLRQRILERKKSLKMLSNIFLSGEYGGTWMEFDKKGNGYVYMNQNISIPLQFQEEIRRMIANKYLYAMFYDEDKKTMVSAEMNPGFNLEEFKEVQKEFYEDVKALIAANGLTNQIRVDNTTIATDIEDATAGKRLGTKKFLEWLRKKRIKPELFRVFGDSAADEEMAEELDINGRNAEYWFVGKELGKKERRFRVLTPQKNFSQLTCQALRELDPVA